MDPMPTLLLWTTLCITYSLHPGGGFVPWVEGYRSPPPGPERETVYGRVRGTVMTLHYLQDKEVERYLGVPFAKPPIGDLRFELPEPPVPWSKTRDATQLPVACPQTKWELQYVESHVPNFFWNRKDGGMDEDCLYLNIYVPRVSPEVLLPVLVHVHGGSNEAGMGAMFDGDVLAALGEIIVITFNYRLGAFGFLSAENSDLPGNHGLYDQTMALKWVKDNIRFFGGDPGKVTIQGHSAGGADVGQHVVSPLSKDLFRYAIMQSGSPLAYWAMLHPPATTLHNTRAFVQSLGCGGWEDTARVKDCLKRLPWRKINNASYNHAPGLYNFSPVVDGHFILDTPETALSQLPVNGHAFMTGITSDEGSLTARVIQQTAERDQRQFRFEEDYPTDYTPPPVKAFAMVPGISHLVYHEYKPWADPYNNTAHLIGVSHVVGDSTFVAPAVQLAKLLSRRAEQTYLYTFNHVSKLSKDPLWMGVQHGVDLFYLFGCPFSGHPLHNYSQLDKNVSRAFIQLWSNFVKTGRPYMDDPDDPFPAFEERNQSYIIVASPNGVANFTRGQRLRPRKVNFWNNLLPKLRKPAPEPDTIQGVLTWVFVGMTSVLLVLVVILALCVAYFRKLAHDRCVVHANDEKSSYQV